ncbi:MAG: hypothetical protein GY711_10840 [bacterium]|nr:hypothetical protein [bacterium]
MKTALSILTAAAFTAGSAQAQFSLWSQSTDNSTIVVGSPACLNNPAGITDNSFWRLYDPMQFGQAGVFDIESVRIGIENANTTSGMQLVEVVIHDGTGFPVGAAGAPVLGIASMMVADTDVSMQTFETFVFAPPVTMAPGQVFSVEVRVFNGQPQGDFFFIGSNGAGETPLDSSYISAPDCAIVDPVPVSTVGFPVQFIIDVGTRGPCPPANWRACVDMPAGEDPSDMHLTFSGPAGFNVSCPELSTDPGGAQNEGVPTVDPDDVTIDVCWPSPVTASGPVCVEFVVPPGMDPTCVSGTWTPSGTPIDCMNVTITPIPGTIGQPYCTANANSTGVPGKLEASGSNSAAAQNVVLMSSCLPLNQFGYYIGSRTQGFIANPGGSQGNLCVLGNQGRYNGPGQVLSSGATGTAMLQVGNLDVPTNPFPGEPILPGDTWNWQMWYRDIGNTNNFTNGLSITFVP